jgi:1-deoxyxylulose-5-phosphate synthase
MEFRRLPHPDLNVSRLCFGTMTFGKPADQAAATRMVDACLDAGVNFFDTANVYQPTVEVRLATANCDGPIDKQDSPKSRQSFIKLLVGSGRASQAAENAPKQQARRFSISR